jgi:hypothetical protein
VGRVDSTWSAVVGLVVVGRTRTSRRSWASLASQRAPAAGRVGWCHNVRSLVGNLDVVPDFFTASRTPVSWCELNSPDVEKHQ